MSNVKELNVNNQTYDIVGKAVVDQNNPSTPLKQWSGTSANLPVSPSSDTLYFVSDTKQILLGSTILSDGLKKTYDLFDFKWEDHQLIDQSWLNADTFSWHDGTVYTDAYNHLNADYNGGISTTETIGSYTITYVLADDGHKITTDETTVQNIYNESGVAWYYVLDTANQRFKLPRELPITDKSKGNGITLGWTDGTNNYGSIVASGSGVSGRTTAYGEVVGGSGGTENFATKIVGITTDPTKSGIISHRANENGQQYLYFYVGQFTQTATEQTAGLNSELFNGKVDLDAGNLSNAGKSLIAGLGMPSGRYIDLTLGASGSTYTAPANGYVNLGVNSNSSSGYINIWRLTDNATSNWENDATQRLYGVQTKIDNTQGNMIILPIEKNKKFGIAYAGVSNVWQFRFVYAEGEPNV